MKLILIGVVMLFIAAFLKDIYGAVGSSLFIVGTIIFAIQESRLEYSHQQLPRKSLVFLQSNAYAFNKANLIPNLMAAILSVAGSAVIIIRIIIIIIDQFTV